MSNPMQQDDGYDTEYEIILDTGEGGFTFTVSDEDLANANSGWPLPSGSGSGSQPITIPVLGGTNAGAGVGTSPGPNISIGKTPKINFAPVNVLVKTDVLYIIVTEDGQCFELREQSPITTREVLGVSKFLNAVTSYMCVAAANVGVMNDIHWSTLAANLSISRHFVAGKPSKDDYDTNGDTIHIFLLDA